LRLTNVLNKLLQYCFLGAFLAASAASGADTPVSVGQAAARPATEPAVRSDVRVDRRSGRLIRRVAAPPILTSPAGPNAAAPALAANPRINAAVEQAARQHGLDPLLVHAVIQVESAYNPYATSHAGAQGLMQLMPATARSLGVRNSFDVEENIRAGVRHLKELKEQYKDDRLALAAYNAGAGAVKKYGWIPPYAETQEYVYKVGKKYGEARRAASSLTAANSAPQPIPPPAADNKTEVPETRPVEAFIDAEGRLHMRTK
jgi:soluble lytic murein transglycosylase-like protein